jgi:hypothetical protein
MNMTGLLFNIRSEAPQDFAKNIYHLYYKFPPEV